MYAETDLIFPYFQTFSPDVQQFHHFSYPHKSNACLSSSISDYDLGIEGDLFKAPEPIIEEPLITLDNISPQEQLSVTDIESLQNEELISDVFHEYKEILAKEAATTETSPLSEVLNYKFPVNKDVDNNIVVKEHVHLPGQIMKSMSAEDLSSMEWIHGAQIKPSFLNITEVDFGNVYGMRRAFSEGDIKALANGNGSLRHLGVGQAQVTSEHTIEDRWQKLSRYRNKKTKRNFGRKIKYACRKALADNQPRIKGRFAKTEESEMMRK